MLTTRVHGHRTVITAGGYRVDAPLAHYFGAGDVYTGLMFAATGWHPGDIQAPLDPTVLELSGPDEGGDPVRVGEILPEVIARLS